MAWSKATGNVDQGILPDGVGFPGLPATEGTCGRTQLTLLRPSMRRGSEEEATPSTVISTRPFVVLVYAGGEGHAAAEDAVEALVDVEAHLVYVLAPLPGDRQGVLVGRDVDSLGATPASSIRITRSSPRANTAAGGTQALARVLSRSYPPPSWP